jgi:hypothetical protein
MRLLRQATWELLPLCPRIILLAVELNRVERPGVSRIFRNGPHKVLATSAPAWLAGLR